METAVSHLLKRPSIQPSQFVDEDLRSENRTANFRMLMSLKERQGVGQIIAYHSSMYISGSTGLLKGNSDEPRIYSQHCQGPRNLARPELAYAASTYRSANFSVRF